MNLNHLTKLHLINFDRSHLPNYLHDLDDMDSIVDSLKNLQSLRLSVSYSQLELI